MREQHCTSGSHPLKSQGILSNGGIEKGEKISLWRAKLKNPLYLRRGKGLDVNCEESYISEISQNPNLNVSRHNGSV